MKGPTCTLCGKECSHICPCIEDGLTRKAKLEVNYWRWRFEGSEWAIAGIPNEWRFMQPKRRTA